MTKQELEKEVGHIKDLEFYLNSEVDAELNTADINDVIAVYNFGELLHQVTMEIADQVGNDFENSIYEGTEDGDFSEKDYDDIKSHVIENYKLFTYDEIMAELTD